MSEASAQSQKQFVHLHLHTTYSLLDGAQLIGDYKNPKKEYGIMNRVKELGMEAVGMTDHGNMFGALEFYLKAKSAGIKPIIGCEVYMAPEDRRRKELQKGELDKAKRYFHFVLLAQNLQGYKNLCKLVTAGYFEGFYYQPRIDREILEKYSEGLIATSACLAGELAQLLMAGKDEKAYEAARYYADLFPGRYFIEIQQNFIKEQTELNPRLVKLARDLSLPLVATNDVHYMTREDAKAQDILMAINQRKTINDENRMRHEVEEFYIKSADEMWELFAEWPDACENTVKIAEMCDLELNLKDYYFPKLETPEGVENNIAFMEKLSWDGLEQRLQLILPEVEEDKRAALREEYNERMNYELDIIKSMGFCDYFLIVSDFIIWAKDNGIPVGPGRGSAAGSLVAYAMRITDIDPIRHVLLFERFLNPERVSMPDIDVDFCEARREEVIEYVRQHYAVPGGPAVAQIATFGKLKAKAAVRDVGRALGLSYGEVDVVAKLIPSGPGVKLQEAIDQEPRLKTLQKNDPKIARLLDVALRLEGLNRHASIHAAGVVISDGRPLDEHLPLFTGSNGEVVTQFDMKGVEKIGLIKFDFLGLKNLTLIKHCVDMIRENFDGRELDIDNIPLEDPETYKLLQKGDTLGVFQLESSGMRNLMMRLKPSCFDDVIALVALYRPGPLNSGMADSFILRKHGQEKIVYDFPQLQPILGSTYGVCIYQEQVMQIANVLASYSLGEADLLRRAMGKKIAEEMAKQRVRFMEGAKANNLDMDKAGKTFDILEEFAAYGFNRSHSAAYGFVAYQTAYLKAHYPHEYMAALLTADSSNSEKILLYLNDVREHGIEVAPPDVNESQKSFSVVNKVVRFGMSGIKGVGEGAIDSILESREKDGPFEDLFDFCKRVDSKKVNKRVMEALVKCGAFDFTGLHRSQVFALVEPAMSYGQLLRKQADSAQFSLFGGPSGENTLDEQPKIPEMDEWPEKERLNYEKEALGLYISGHPLSRYAADLGKLTSCGIGELSERQAGEVTIAGIITAYKDMVTKKGSRMAFIQLEDLTGNVEVSVFPRVFQECSELIESSEPLLIKGKMEKDERSTKIIATEVKSLAEVRAASAKEILLNLSCDELSNAKVQMLRQVLQRHTEGGRCHVVMNLELPERATAKLRVGEEFKLKPSETLVEDLERLFGRNPAVFQ